MIIFGVIEEFFGMKAFFYYILCNRGGNAKGMIISANNNMYYAFFIDIFKTKIINLFRPIGRNLEFENPDLPAPVKHNPPVTNNIDQKEVQ